MTKLVKDAVNAIVYAIGTCFVFGFAIAFVADMVGKLTDHEVVWKPTDENVE